MAKREKLSVIAVFHNQRDVVEATIEALYELPHPALELFLIDDGSTDDTAEIIQSLLEYYGHEETYFFDHPEQYGTGYSITEALNNVSGDFLWLVDSVESIDQSELSNLLNGLKESGLLCAIQSGNFSGIRIQDWMKQLEKGSILSNRSFIWNWNAIPERQRFINPYLNAGHAVELAIRLLRDSQFRQTQGIFNFTGEETATIDTNTHKELLFALLRRDDFPSLQKEHVLQFLINEDKAILDAPASGHIPREQHPDTKKTLEEARKHHREGNNVISLELLNKILANEPDNVPAKKLKIAVLERMRRYVEAAEIKHSIKGYTKDDENMETSQWEEAPDTLVETEEPPEPVDYKASVKEQPEEQPQQKPVDVQPEDIITSVIIPTASDRKSLLEKCLVALGKYASPKDTELIIIDNASLDDTCDYLEQLSSDRFFNCKIIVNPMNAGFARSVNMGMEQAVGKYMCVMHNDVFLTSDALGKMRMLLDKHPEYGLIGPRTERTLNPQQLEGTTAGNEDEINTADYLDSFCMMFRTDMDIRFDEQYELAYFEDIDYSLQVRDKGWKVGIAPNITVDHLFGITTSDLGLYTDSPQYWKNIERFNEKWQIQTTFPESKKDDDTIERLLILNQIMNPHYPEPHLLQLYNEWFTSEIKTVVLEKEWDHDTLINLVELMMKTDQRDVLRQLEDKLEHIELSEDILYELVHFYYSRNIYSRCRHYIKELGDGSKPFRFRLIELKMLVNEKDLESAIPLLKDLLDEVPSLPDLYQISGEVHQLEGNTKEAQKFYELATQLDPYRYPESNPTYTFED
jgi:GT2 family glycosyltransferase